MTLGDIIWEYIGIIGTMSNNLGMQGFDERRSEVHNKIVDFMGEKYRDAIDRVAHNMPDNIDPEMFIRFVKDEKQHKEYLWYRNRRRIH